MYKLDRGVWKLETEELGCFAHPKICDSVSFMTLQLSSTQFPQLLRAFGLIPIGYLVVDLSCFVYALVDC
jgi:hypothetical protein